MAAIVFSTALKTSALARVSVATDDKFMDPNEFGARVRCIEVNHVADGAVTASLPIILARFDKSVTILSIEVITDSTVTTAVMGTTPVSLPVDTTTNVLAAVIATANVAVRPYLAINLDVAATEPEYLFWKPASGTLADTKILKGRIYFVDNT
mgnify:CR=1 FL=1|tara:strand:+ start:4416 stop:4874 length:459 start_codon:yes stop_codon:yes gene_type:complete